MNEDVCAVDAEKQSPLKAGEWLDFVVYTFLRMAISSQRAHTLMRRERRVIAC
ncbi:MAG: hypothetical protein AAF699_17130 [Pseudomonadota bacterium]